MRKENVNTMKSNFVPPIWIVSVIKWVRSVLGYLYDKMLPPHLALMEKASGVIINRAIFAATKLNIADHLSQESKTSEEIAILTSTKTDYIDRLLRLLVSHGIFRYKKGRYSNNSMSTFMRKEVPNSVHYSLQDLGSDHFRISYQYIVETLKSGQSGLEIQEGGNLFKYLKKNSEEEHVFSESMIEQSSVEFSSILKFYPNFSKFDSICDIGGGEGHLIGSILTKYQKLKGILFDEENVLKSAEQYLHKHNLQDRCKKISGNFFHEVPTGSDCYILKWILHDWDDENSLKILNQVRRSMKKDSILLVIEIILPKSDHVKKQEPGYMLDMVMMMSTGGKERTLLDWTNLFDQAELKINRIIRLPMLSSIIELSKMS